MNVGMEGYMDVVSSHWELKGWDYGGCKVVKYPMYTLGMVGRPVQSISIELKP